MRFAARGSAFPVAAVGARQERQVERGGRRRFRGFLRPFSTRDAGCAFRMPRFIPAVGVPARDSAGRAGTFFRATVRFSAGPLLRSSGKQSGFRNA